MNRVGKSVNKAFGPVKEEVRKKKKNPEEKSSKEGDDEDDEDDGGDEEKLEVDEFKTAAELEGEYKGKVKGRCEDVYNGGVGRCKKVFERVYNRCRDKVPMVGLLVCWVVQVDFICDLLRYIPDIVGANCNSVDSVDSGFGESYKAEEDSLRNLENGFDVNIQYKVMRTEEDLDYTGVEHMRKTTMHEFNEGKNVLDFVFSIISRVLTFVFVLVIIRAYNYYKSHQSDLRFDNCYITSYFREIDARRKVKGKKVLLPFKKTEKKEITYPTTVKLSGPELKKLGSRSMVHFTKVFLVALVFLTDYCLSRVLQLIATKSRIDFHQTGTNHMEAKVNGTGFMSQIVRSFLSGLNTHQELDEITTNAACVPSPKILSESVYYTVFGIYLVAWLLMVLEAYGLRLRRLISGYFFRKREKMRILFLYNDMMRKRKNFLKIMKRRVKRRARKHKLKQVTSMAHVLLRICPSLAPCLERFKKVKCLVCEETMKKGWHTCPTKDCGFMYCDECWHDLQGVCYACLPVSEISSPSSSDSGGSSDESI